MQLIQDIYIRHMKNTPSEPGLSELVNYCVRDKNVALKNVTRDKPFITYYSVGSENRLSGINNKGWLLNRNK